MAAAERVVVSERLSVGKLLQTVLALVRGPPHVFVHVTLEMCLNLETLVAYVAPVTVLPNMALLVFGQRLYIFEVLTTIVTI